MHQDSEMSDDSQKVVKLTAQDHLDSLSLYAQNILKRNGDTSIIDPEKEGTILQIIRFDKMWKSFMESLKENVSQEMSQFPNTTTARGTKVSVSVFESRSARYVITDPEIVDEHFIISEQKPNKENIDAFEIQHGFLPQGIEYGKPYTVVRVDEVKKKE